MNFDRLSVKLLCLVVLIVIQQLAFAAARTAPLPPPEPPANTWKDIKFNQINQVLVSPDGKRVAVYYIRPTWALVLYDRFSGKEIHRFDPKLTRGGSFTLHFTPDSKRLVTSGTRTRVPPINEACVWDVGTGKVLRVIPFRQRQYLDYGRNQLDVSNKLLIVRGEDHVAGVYELATGKDLGVISGDQRAAILVLSRDGRWLFTSDRDDTMCIWDVENRKLVRTMTGNAKVLAISYDAAWCATISAKGELRVFDRTTGHLKASTDSGLWKVSDHLLFSPDGKTLVAIGRGLNYGLRVWDWQSSDNVRGADRLRKVEKASSRPTKLTEGAIRQASMASDGTLLVWGSLGLGLWDIGLPKTSPPPAMKPPSQVKK